MEEGHVQLETLDNEEKNVKYECVEIGSICTETLDGRECDETAGREKIGRVHAGTLDYTYSGEAFESVKEELVENETLDDNERNENAEIWKEWRIEIATLDDKECGETAESVKEVRVKTETPNDKEHYETAENLKEGDIQINLINDKECSKSVECEKIFQVQNEKLADKECDKMTEIDSQTENIETGDSSDNKDELQGQVLKNRQSRKKKRQTRQKLGYVKSNLDDDIPLSPYMQDKVLLENDEDTSKDQTYNPSEDSQNPSDSEAEYLSQKKYRKHLKRDRRFKKNSNQTEKFIENKKQHTASNIASLIRKGVEVAEMKRKRIQKETEKVEALLLVNGLKREPIRAYGDCFFEASGMQLGITASVLRRQLYKTLDDNLEDYISFVMSGHNPDNEEEFVMEYLSEIEKLKQDGYWTSNVADLLSLALAKFSRRNVIIYTNEDEQPIIKVSPLETFPLDTDKEQDIKLMYVSLPGVFEHYDSCSEISIKEELTAPPRVDILCEEGTGASVTHGQESSHQETAPQPKKNTRRRKKTVYITPKKTILPRKRKATPENWKKNIRKRLKLSGEEYISADGKTKQARSLKDVDCSKCRFKCNSKITQKQRQQVFNSFWAIRDYQRQKDYVCANVEERNTRTMLDETGTLIKKKRQFARRFFIEVEGARHNICSVFFMKTLAIGKAYIDHAMKHKEEGHFVGTDLRGRHTPHNKLDTYTIDYVKSHIQSFPRVADRYVRNETKRQILGSKLTLPKMYELYLEKCKSDGVQPVTISTYRKLFNEN